LYNCIKQAGDELQIDIESLVKIFNRFSSSANSTEEIKTIPNFPGEDYENLLCHVGTSG
jgi:hypothetical protein